MPQLNPEVVSVAVKHPHLHHSVSITTYRGLLDDANCGDEGAQRRLIELFRDAYHHVHHDFSSIVHETSWSDVKDSFFSTSSK